MGNIHRTRSLLGLGLLILVVMAINVASASASASSREAREYTKDFDVSMAQAEETLEVQDKANEDEVVLGLEDRLDSRYAGIWFDNQTSEYVVPLLAGAGSMAVSSEFSQADLGADEFRTSSAQFSWEELEAAQDDLNKALLPLIEEGMVQTSLDPRTNSVAVTLAGGISADAEREVRGLTAGSSVAVEVRAGNTAKLEGKLEACSDPFCDAPLRGGAAIYPNFNQDKACTAGFPAVGANGDRYILTAGHCVHQNYTGAPTYLNWTSKDSALQAHGIGAVAQWGSGGATEWAKIKANGSWWDSGTWPAQIAYWGAAVSNQAGDFESKGSPIDLNYAITGQGTNVVGSFACHTGIITGSSCGSITGVNVTYNFAGGPNYNLVEISGVCSIPGDSGGPYFTGHSALGLHVGSVIESNACKGNRFYTDINLATAALNVTIAPPAPKVTATASVLNGNPGWTTVSGRVTSGGMGIEGKTVKFKLFKWENNNWVLKAEPPAVATNSSGNFSLNNWNGVGPGSWIAQAVFPAQGPFGEGASSTVTEGSFTVRDGYQIVAGHSNRCMDVKEGSRENKAPIWQWDCVNPVTGQNQVFKLVPNSEGNVQIVARHSNRCVSVIGGSTTAGTALEQYDCLGPTQAGQIWQVQPTATANVVKLIAKHSGQCMDVQGQKPEREVPYTQWNCLNQANQLFTLYSVDSAPAPTETYLTVPEGERLSGEYGYVTGQGNVKAGGYPLSGQAVELTYEKEKAGGGWESVYTTYPTLNSEGFYQYKYHPVGVGNWRMQAKYPGKGGELAASTSPGYVNFHIGWGFRLVARHSGKCMSIPVSKANGLQFNQWTCSGAPYPGDGQVFTFVPQENGAYFLILSNANSTPQLGKCLDVAAASTGDGAAINQWDCGGSDNQKWQKVPIAGQPPWVGFIAKHSGKCIDVWQQSQANGAGIHQWGCFWPGSQQWRMESVG
jgi:Ricin-type beta-trefoil lectin domain-like